MKHFYSGFAMMREHEPRNRPLSPVWNIFDLTPEDRGDWNPKLEYD